MHILAYINSTTLGSRNRHRKPVLLLDTIIILVILICQTLVEARFKRCFVCRSRGALGDCKDPFILNSTTFDGQMNTKSALEAVPCASGWCAKIIEDDFGDSIAATERSCMTRPPTDNEERCSETIFENHRDRKVFLCMCYGDLCNASTSVTNSNFLLMTLCMTVTGFMMSKYFSHHHC